MATTADTHLGSNDRAAMYRVGHSGIQITQDDSENDDYRMLMVVI